MNRRIREREIREAERDREAREAKRGRVTTVSRETTEQTYIDAELELRKKYTEFTGVDVSESFEIGLFTRDEQIDKYAKEISFWSSRWLFNDKIMTSPHWDATNRLMQNGELATMKHMCEFYKNDEEMQNDIMTSANILYMAKFRQPMNPLTLCVFNRFKTGARRRIK